jgi:uncharacterized protein YecT (DUF1311 family)
MKHFLTASLLVLFAATADAAEPDKLKDIDAIYEDCIASASATVASKQCGFDAYESADSVLNKTYNAITVRYAGADPDNAEILSRLKTAQRAWVPFRDAQCELEAADSLGGSNEGVILNSCLYQQTATRVKTLREQFESGE